MEVIFNEDENKELDKKLDKAHVKTRKQSGFTLSYIEGWHAIAEANRIFGFDGWTRETIDLIENHTPFKNKNSNYVVSFRAKVRVTIKGVAREGIGHGSGVSFNLNDAYESAIKEAETDAMKRAFMTFGNVFGLALYDKKQENVEEVKPEVKPFTGEEFTALQKEIRESATHAELNTAREKATAAKPRMTKAQIDTIKKEVLKATDALTPKTQDLVNQPLEGRA